MSWEAIRERLPAIVAAAERRGARIVNTPEPEPETDLAVVLRLSAAKQGFEAIKQALRAPTVPPRADVVGPPASDSEVDAAEVLLGAPFPASVREALTRLSASVNVAWNLGKRRNVPFHGHSGGLVLSLAGLVRMQKAKARFVAQVFPDPRKKEARPWHHAFAVIAVGNGDYLGVAQKTGQANGPVVYLSHDDAVEHGAVLAGSFGDFLDRWTRLACVGPEGLAPFLGRKGLEPDAARAVEWRAWLGLRL